MSDHFRVQPLGVAAAPARTRHHALVTEIRTWALAHGTSVDPDVLAVILDASGDAEAVWTRPRVNHLLRYDVPNWSSAQGCLWPEHAPEAIWAYLTFLADTDRMPHGSDPLDRLTEPLRCYGGLGENGQPRPEGELPPFPCECFLDVQQVSKPGLSRWRTAEGNVIELWRPSPAEPQLIDWWKAFALISREARRQDNAWLLHMEDFDVVGRVEPRPGWPSLWVYHHAEAHGELYVDDHGEPYRLRPDRRRRGGYRFEAIDLIVAVWRTGIPHLATAAAPGPPCAGQDDAPNVVPLWR